MANHIKQKRVHDRYGRVLCIGKKVAFNFSGEVAIGFITAIKPSICQGFFKDCNGEPYYNFHVRHQNSNRITVVKDRTSLTNVK